MLLERIIESSSNIDDVVLPVLRLCDGLPCGRKDVPEVDRLRHIREGLLIDRAEATQRCWNRQVHHRGRRGHTKIRFPKRGGRRSKDIKHTLYGIQHGYCNGCKYHYRFKDLEVDHTIPRIKGGQDDDGSLQLLCGNCNRRKGGKLTMAELNAVLTKEGMKFGKGSSWK